MIAEPSLRPIGGLETFKMEWYRVVGKARETPDTFTIRMKARGNGEIAFEPGQFNMLYAYGVHKRGTLQWTADRAHREGCWARD
ncbi:MAG: hypothetical protein QW663_06120 [Nitrososphaerota archaeon]